MEMTKSVTYDSMQAMYRSTIPYLVLHVFVAQFEADEVFERPEEGLVEAEVWQLRGVRQEGRHDRVQVRHRRRGHRRVAVARRLGEETKRLDEEPCT